MYQTDDFGELASKFEVDLLSAPDRPDLIRIMDLHYAVLLAAYESFHDVEISLQELKHEVDTASEYFNSQPEYATCMQSNLICQHISETVKTSKIGAIRSMRAVASSRCRNALNLQIKQKFPELAEKIKTIESEAEALVAIHPVMARIPIADEDLSEFQRIWYYHANTKAEMSLAIFAYTQNLHESSVSISNDGSFSVQGNVVIPRVPIGTIPVSFHTVSGSFTCEDAGLVSLRNIPRNIGGDLNLSYNNRISSFKELSNVNIGGKLFAYDTLYFKFKSRIPKHLRGKIEW